MKWLFQGDSITDAGREYGDPLDFGDGYVRRAMKNLQDMFPDVEFDFINLGVSGNQTMHLVERLESDFVDVQPDVVSILIGVNDVWHHAEERDWIPNEVFEERYRTVLQALKEKTNAKIIIMEPFLIPVEEMLHFREDLDPKIQVIRKLAREFADVYIPLDGLLAEAYIGDDPLSFAWDGVHPSEKGADFIAKIYAERVAPLVIQ